ncbi:MAG: hypothetical protein ACTS3F_04240 [Phycisphaerales bacterium]
MFENIKPGDQIRCTVIKHVNPGDHADTIARLMRQDPDIKRKLKGAQEHRRRTNPVQRWGGRLKTRAPKATRYANVNLNESWTMRYFPQIAPDFKSVERYLKIEKI